MGRLPSRQIGPLDLISAVRPGGEGKVFPARSSAGSVAQQQVVESVEIVERIELDLYFPFDLLFPAGP